MLRDVHAATGCPVLLLATKDLHDRIVRSADADHGQLYSRFDVVHHLTEDRDVHAGGKALFTVEDIKALYQQPHLSMTALPTSIPPRDHGSVKPKDSVLNSARADSTAT